MTITFWQWLPAGGVVPLDPPRDTPTIRACPNVLKEVAEARKEMERGLGVSGNGE